MYVMNIVCTVFQVESEFDIINWFSTQYFFEKH